MTLFDGERSTHKSENQQQLEFDQGTSDSSVTSQLERNPCFCSFVFFANSMLVKASAETNIILAEILLDLEQLF